MTRSNYVLLLFSPEYNNLRKNKELCYGLSAALQVSSTLWVVNDETITLERLGIKGPQTDGGFRFENHKQFSLNNYLTLPVPPSLDGDDASEADIEGLAFDGHYLWLVGSHSLKRNKPKQKDGPDDGMKRLAKVSRDGNRYLLARIPLVEEGGNHTLKQALICSGRSLLRLGWMETLLETN